MTITYTPSIRWLAALLLVLAGPALLPTAQAQLRRDAGIGDDRWDDRFGRPGLNYVVGPLAYLPNGDLVVSGPFWDTGGNPEADNIARWDGTSWQALGVGLSAGAAQLAVAANGDLYAGGSFLDAGGDPAADYLARWDGTRWHKVGGGLNGRVRALVLAPNGDVIVGGEFTDAGGNPSADGLARWNGTSWQPYGPGLNGPVDGIGLAPNGDTYIVGTFLDVGGNPNIDRVARWNGTSWGQMGAPMNGYTNRLVMLPSGYPAIAGNFTNLGGNPNADNIAYWNGTSWQAYGTGLNLGAGLGVGEMRVAPNGDLLVGGDFVAAGGNAATRNLARWNGTSWQAVGPTLSDGVNGIALAPNGDIVVGGNFETAGSNTHAAYLARLSGGTWQGFEDPTRLGLNGNVYSVLAAPGGGFYVAGDFTDAGGNPDADYFAFWDGNAWQKVGTRFSSAPSMMLLTPGGELLLGGSFTDVGGNPAADYLIRWNGTNWLPFAAPLNGGVGRMAWAPNGDLVVSGGFLDAGGNPNADRLARWNGTSWQPIGTGLNAAPSVLAVAPNNDVIVGGNGFLRFGTSFGISYLGRWDGTAWRGYPNASGTPSALAVMPNGDLLVSTLTQPNMGGISGVSRWNGTAWVRLGPAFSGTVHTFKVYSMTDIIIGGQLSWSGDLNVSNGIIHCDGTKFYNYGSGLSTIVYDADRGADGLLGVGGTFTSLNNYSKPSSKFAIFRDAPRPIIRSFAPASGPAGTVVTVRGSGFTGATQLAFGSVNAPGFVVTSDSTMTVTVPAAAFSSPVVVVAPGGTANSAGFYLVPAPCAAAVAVTASGPTALPPGGAVTLTATAAVPAFSAPVGAGLGPQGSSVYALAPQADGKVVVGGNFATFHGQYTPSDNLLRLNADGSLDTGFNAGGIGFDGVVHAVLALPDGSVLAGGEFTRYNGTLLATPYLVRLQADGSLDPSFNPGGAGVGGGYVRALAAMPDGRVVVAGEFTRYNDRAVGRITRLLPSGALDLTFNNGYVGFESGIVYAVAVQPDGRIVVGNDAQTRYNSALAPIGLLRLTPDGLLDPLFSYREYALGFTGGVVRTLAVQPDGNILVGGTFTSYHGVDLYGDNLLRVLPNGMGDITFNFRADGFNGPVRAVLVQPDGSVLVGGDFTSYNGDASAPDYLIRLSSTGQRLPGPGSFDAPVRALALPGDDRVLAGGDFTSYAGNAATPDGLARLTATNVLDDTPAALPGASFSWSPGGSTANPLSVSTPGAYVATLAGCTAASAPVVVTASAALTDLVVSTALSVSGSYNNVTITGTGVATLSDTLRVAGTLTVQAGGQLLTSCQPLLGSGSFVLEAGATLVICHPDGISRSGARGAIQLSGSRSYSDDAYYRYAAPTPQVTGDGLPALVRELQVDDFDLTLTADLDLREALRFVRGDLDLAGHTLTLRSTAAGTALIDNTGGRVRNNTGTCHMQRYLDPSRNAGLGYRHLGSCVAGMMATQLQANSVAPVLTAAYNTSATPGLVTPFPTLFGYDESRLGTVVSNYSAFDKGWVVPAAGQALAPFTGYAAMLPGGATVTFTGRAFASGAQSFSYARGPQAEAGWLLVANPYPSPFDLSVAGSFDRSNVDAAAFVFESTSQYAGQYRSYVNGLGTGTGSPLLAAGQGFFVRVSTAGQPATIAVRPAGRGTVFAAQPTLRRGAADLRPQLRLSVQPATGPADEFIVYAEAGATPAADAEFDATKLLNPGNASLAALAPGGAALAIQGLPVLAAGTVVPLTLTLPAAGSASFAATLANLPVGLTAYLTDALTGARHDLSTAYAFTAPAGTVAGRFALVFGPAATALGATAASVATLTLFPNPAQHTATLTLAPAAVSRAITVLDALGRVVRRATLPAHAASATLDVAGLPAGMYVVRCDAATARLVVE